MKRLLAILLTCTLMLTMSLGSGLASGVDTRFVGTWYVHTIKVGDESFGTGDTGMIVTIKVDGDGTATWTDSDGSQDTGTWTSEGDSMLISWDEGGVMELIYIDGALVSNPEDDGTVIIHLEGSKPKQTADEQLDYRKDVTASDFDGNWMSVEITAMGFTFPMSETGESVDPFIEGGKLIALNGSRVIPSVTSQFVAGTLVIYNPIVDVVSVMNLLADGSAVLRHLHEPDAYFTLIPVQ